MTQARKTVVEPGMVGVFHVVSRCVRRAFLCGSDVVTGQDFEHRREWIRRRLGELSEVFGVELFAYAVMANHFHLVLRTVPDVAAGWSAEEVVRRWALLFPLERDEGGRAVPLSEDALRERAVDGEKVGLWRGRLGDLSWFMRCLNENIARRANAEDGCKGRFWEGRFKCQRLEDAGAVLACMTYVDLNPVRAGIAESPELSAFTSVFDRIARRRCERVEGRLAGGDGDGGEVAGGGALAGVRAADSGELSEVQSREQVRVLGELRAARGRAGMLVPVECIRAGRGESVEPWGLDEERYLELLDATGRAMRLGKAGRIDPGLAPVLERLQLDEERWVETIRRYGSLYYRVCGRVERIREAAVSTTQRWFRKRAGVEGVYRERPA